MKKNIAALIMLSLVTYSSVSLAVPGDEEKKANTENSGDAGTLGVGQQDDFDRCPRTHVNESQLPATNKDQPAVDPNAKPNTGTGRT